MDRKFLRFSNGFEVIFLSIAVEWILADPPAPTPGPARMCTAIGKKIPREFSSKMSKLRSILTSRILSLFILGKKIKFSLSLLEKFLIFKNPHQHF